MALSCLFQRPADNESARLPPVADRESELVEIFAAAEMAFDRVLSGRKSVAA